MASLSLDAKILPVATLCALLASGTAAAVPLTSLRGLGLNAAYSSYAARGDCSHPVRLTIAESGFTVRALARTVKSSRFEYARSFFGPSYESVSAVLFPFRRMSTIPVLL